MDLEQLKDEKWLLRSAFYNSLELASNLKCKSISIPAISNLAYDFPIKNCAEIFYGTLVEFLDSNENNTLHECWYLIIICKCEYSFLSVCQRFMYVLLSMRSVCTRPPCIFTCVTPSIYCVIFTE